MKRYRVVLSPGVEAEMLDAASFIAQDSPANAAAWLEGMFDAIQSLATMPERCGLIRENDELAAELRELIYQSHRIIFFVDVDRVRVLHVRHGARSEWHGP